MKSALLLWFVRISAALFCLFISDAARAACDANYGVYGISAPPALGFVAGKAQDKVMRSSFHFGPGAGNCGLRAVSTSPAVLVRGALDTSFSGIANLDVRHPTAERPRPNWTTYALVRTRPDAAPGTYKIRIEENSVASESLPPNWRLVNEVTVRIGEAVGGKALHAEIASVASDSLGNVILTGTFTGVSDFGGTVLDAGTQTHGFVAKYASSGALVWVRQLASSFSFPVAVQVAKDGTVFTTGDFTGTLTIDGTTLTASSLDSYLLRLNSNTGALAWGRMLESNELMFMAALALDAQENPIAAGDFHGTLSIGGGSHTSSNAGSACFFARFSRTTGAYLSSAHIAGVSGSGSCALRAVARAPDNRVVIAGSFNGTVDFSASTAAGTVAELDRGDAFVARYTNLGQFELAHQLGGETADRAVAVQVDVSGDIVAAGTTDGTFNFVRPDGRLLYQFTSAGGSDGFVTKISKTGTHLWSTRFGGTNDDQVRALVLDAAGAPWVTGHFNAQGQHLPAPQSGAIDAEVAFFGAGGLPYLGGGSDTFLVGLDKDHGRHAWGEALGSSDPPATGIAPTDAGVSIATNTRGEIILAGKFYGSLVLRSGLTLSGSNQGDAFFATFRPVSP